MKEPIRPPPSGVSRMTIRSPRQLSAARPRCHARGGAPTSAGGCHGGTKSSAAHPDQWAAVRHQSQKHTCGNGQTLAGARAKLRGTGSGRRDDPGRAAGRSVRRDLAGALPHVHLRVLASGNRALFPASPTRQQTLTSAASSGRAAVIAFFFLRTPSEPPFFAPGPKRAL